MSSKLIPPNPDEVMVIRDVTPNVVTFSVPFLRFGRFPVGGRGTLVRLSSGALAVFSPVALTEATKAKVASLGGDVRYLVATDIEHHIFLSEWAAAYPNAKLIGPEGLPEKRHKAARDDPKIGDEPFAVAVTKVMNGGEVVARIGDDFAADFEMEYVHAHPNKELVFLYKPDKVLIQADLMFNLPGIEQYSRVPDAEKPKLGVLGRFFGSLQSTEGEALGMKRFLWYAVSRKDRAGFDESVRRIAGWDFETIIPCHGETIVGNGKEVFRKVFAWHLEGKGAKA
ncbi:beta-lactamase-like protein [Achaetomium macrosporum]|uniref:Beta-lactamase-like protein n=1 Tax=Achaetomium macrosporum TaxID=79813 RepID=A0AAN7CC62_9PEZI|nr:beta-lactamase-like protein [Achaetomium macrosporum]